MEPLLSLFIFHDSYVVSFLVLGITIIVVMLLLFNHKSPKSIIRTEMESEDGVEGALRRVLSEKQWVGAGGEGAATNVGPEDHTRLGELEEEVLTKDRAIAELNKKLTQGGGGNIDDSELLQRIAELEERLQEYEIIEDDIADLSLYRTENQKLKDELDRLKAMVGNDDGRVVAVETSAETGTDIVKEPADAETQPQGADLVAEFEEVVNKQDQIENDGGTSVKKETASDSGKVMVTEKVDPAESTEKSHPILKGVDPDSKEEAEVFISELKSLKEGLKK